MPNPRLTDPGQARRSSDLANGSQWKRFGLPRAAGLAGLLLCGTAHAQEVPVFHLAMKDGRFEPTELEVPAGAPFQLVVRNLDPFVMEFESTDLSIERIITAGRQTRLRLGPLAPGRYVFFDEFQEDKARGALIAKE